MDKSNKILNQEFVTSAFKQLTDVFVKSARNGEQKLTTKDMHDYDDILKELEVLIEISPSILNESLEKAIDEHLTINSEDGNIIYSHPVLGMIKQLLYKKQLKLNGGNQVR